MKIRTLTIENFKSIKHLQIDFNGSDATICGQNGAGKTSILDAVCWLLANKMSDGKTGEPANLHDLGKVSVVEITMDSGLKIRRECNGKSLYFVQGVPCGFNDFKTQIAAIFKNAVPALLTPFNFFRLHYIERRNILLDLFAKNIDVDLNGLEDIFDDLKKFSPEQIIKTSTYNKKQLEKELAQIPARIDELQKNIVTIDTEKINAEIAELEQKFSAQLEKVKTCQTASSKKLENYNQALKLESQARQIEEKISDLRAEYRNNEIELNRLRQEYGDVQKATSGTCPTCGSKIPSANLEKIKTRLQEIISQGKSISETQEQLKQEAANLQKQADELRQKSAELKEKFELEDANSTTAENLQAALIERDELQNKLSNLKLQLADAKHSAENQKRIEQLKAQEVSIADEISQCDKKIFLAETYIRRKIEILEHSVNQHFQFVQFKMFEDFKTVEGVKECCEPTLNGVPYAALSKGEQLKASLDILNALQVAYDVELPVFIDDAESYTSNSFVDLPNQVILLKAVEGVRELKFDIDEKFFEGSLSA